MPTPNCRDTVGEITYYPQKLDGTIKYRANFEAHNTIKTLELEERGHRDGNTRVRELHDTYARQTRVEPNIGRSTDAPMEEPTGPILAKNQVPLIGKKKDGRADQKAVECSLGHVATQEQCLSYMKQKQADY